MKKSIFALLAVCLIFTACVKNEKIEPGILNVTVELPTEFSSFNITTIDVVLENVVSAEIKHTQKPDASGKVIFKDLVPGTYKLSAMVSGKYIDSGISQPGEFKLIGSENNVTVAADQTKTITLTLVASDAGGLVISEFYYNLTWTEAGRPYLDDPYLHIYNNSDEVLYADGLIIGNSTVTSKNPEIFTDEEFVYLTKAFQIPGNGTEHPIEPGKYIVLAQDGMNHNEDENGNPGRSVDLSNADFEFWTHDNGASREDIDFKNVPNLIQLYFYNKGWDWMPHNSHPAIVLFRSDDFNAYEKVDEYPNSKNKVIKVPIKDLIDGFEGDEDGDNAMKHLPNYLTRSVFAGIEAGWKGLVVKRKVLKTVDGRDVLQNTRDSNEDFETYEIFSGSSTTKKIAPRAISRIINQNSDELEVLREVSNDF